MRISSPVVRSAAIVLAAAILAMLPVRSASASMLQIVAPSPFLSPGQSETISVQLTSTQNFVLTSADIEIAYDNTRFSVSNVQLGSLDTDNGTGYDYSITTNTLGSNPGILYAEIDSNQSQASISPGQIGTIETFTLTALANAPLGGALGDINLLARQLSSPGIETAVYDMNYNAIGLTPAPTNGYDPTIDGTVKVVVAAVVPEPSSLILMGLGGSIALTTALWRKKTRRPPAA